MAGGYYSPLTGTTFQRAGSLANVPIKSTAPTNPAAGAGVGVTPNPVGQGGAGPAVQAGVSLTPFGSPIDRPPALQNTIAPSLRPDEYIGVRTDVPQRVMPEVASPYAINWDDTEKMGSLGVRRGLLMLSDNKRTIDGGSTYAAYYGAGIVAIPPSDYSETSNKAGFLLVSLSSSPTFGATGVTNAGWIVRTSPKWSRERDLEDVVSLTIVVTNPSAGVLRITAVDSGGVNINAVEALTLRYSRIGYPTSIDGDDQYESVAVTNYDRGIWNGAATGNIDTGSLAAGTIFVSGWSLSRLGPGVRAIGKVVVA